jgi:Na+-driven multidrug efflux pump
MLAIGGSVMAGSYLGENNLAAASNIFAKAMATSLLFALVISISGLLLIDQLVLALGLVQSTMFWGLPKPTQRASGKVLFQRNLMTMMANSWVSVDMNLELRLAVNVVVVGLMPVWCAKLVQRLV